MSTSPANQFILKLQLYHLVFIFGIEIYFIKSVTISQPPIDGTDTRTSPPSFFLRSYGKVCIFEGEFISLRFADTQCHFVSFADRGIAQSYAYDLLIPIHFRENYHLLCALKYSRESAYIIRCIYDLLTLCCT